MLSGGPHDLGATGLPHLPVACESGSQANRKLQGAAMIAFPATNVAQCPAKWPKDPGNLAN